MQKIYELEEYQCFDFSSKDIENIMKMRNHSYAYNQKHLMFTPYIYNHLNINSFKKQFEKFYMLKSDLFINSYNKSILTFKYDVEMEKYNKFIKFNESKIEIDYVEEVNDRKFTHYKIEKTEYTHNIPPITNIKDVFMVYVYYKILLKDVKAFKFDEEMKIVSRKKEFEKELHENDIEEAVEFYKKIKSEYPEIIEILKNK